MSLCWGLLITASASLLPPKKRVLFQPEAALGTRTSETHECGRAGTLIPDFLKLTLKGEMLKYMFVLAVMGALRSRRQLTMCSYSCFP